MRSIRVITALAVLTIVAAVLTGCAGGSGSSATPVSNSGVALAQTVSAVGNGKASAAPDTVEFGFGVTVRDKTGKGAMAKAATASDKIVKALLGAGIAKEDIQTQNLSLYPQYDKDGREVIGYEVNVNVRASTDDLASAPKVIEAATAAGATQVNGPVFTMSEDNAAHGKALEDAVADAKARAEVMAKAAGQTVGDVVRITEGTVQQVTPLYSTAYAAKTMDAAGAPQIQPGELDAYATVTVEFELK